MTLNNRPLVLCSILAALAAAPAAAQSVECSPVVKNGPCTVTINRESPSTPQPFLMTGHAPIQIVVRKRPFDNIEVNSTFTDVAPVDPLAAIIGAFAPSFAGVTISNWSSFNDNPKLAMIQEKTIKEKVKNSKLMLDLQWIDRQQDKAKDSLEAANTSLKTHGKALAVFANVPASRWNTNLLETEANTLIKSLRDAEKVSVASGVVAALGEAVSNARKAYATIGYANPAIGDEELNALNALLNDVEAHQAQLDASAKSLVTAQDGLREARILLEGINESADSRAAALTLTETIETNAHGPARSVKAAITLTDMLSGDKTDLGTVTASWNSTRWEVSAGTVFSTRPITSYGVANSVITESSTRPMVVPFALAHFNLWETTAGQHRVALLASGGIGVNPNTKNADFGYGLSLGYRGIYLSALNHKAREVMLSGGLQTGQTVASTVTEAATELGWKSKFRLGIGLTLRVPF
jgi:hypothetical protein